MSVLHGVIGRGRKCTFGERMGGQTYPFNGELNIMSNFQYQLRHNRAYLEYDLEKFKNK